MKCGEGMITLGGYRWEWFSPWALGKFGSVVSQNGLGQYFWGEGVGLRD
jgi:hypothetical protein